MNSYKVQISWLIYFFSLNPEHILVDLNWEDWEYLHELANQSPVGLNLTDEIALEWPDNVYFSI